ncbi:NTP transferase domain-containing protein [Salipiger sp. PrR002]|uniref:nucleotidyltransferase family protein n=1 Tax=Salipiger sp. PrR002 TaxID=2706489 RepID=UPI0013BAB7D9|nr:nucleotidyltransferase family protein [Salipiger sp. PrR002]NDV97981.1 nucleotidyltransferase family protein [Salipiger sp. PrR002]NDW56956.1 nucleotidyltransferase family protein [Salipiger sp. PrR004]
MGGIAVLIPAAGTSSRMRGADKLLKHVGGRALLRRQAEEALRAVNHVTVTLPDHDHPRAAALAGLPVQLIAVPDADQGMSASLRRGVGMLPRGIDAVVILPADMPDLRAEDIDKLVRGFRAMPHPALQQGCTEDGTPGHPVLFPADCFSAIQMLSGDEGARSVLATNRHRLRMVPLPGRRALTDLDTPEAWQDWERERAALDPC